MNKLFHSIEKAIVKHRRKTLAREIFARHGGIVQCGSFKGMHLDGVANTSQAAHGLKILGLYESPVTDQLVNWCPAETLVDVGAADGYYPIGMLKAGLVKQAVCFEATEAGRQAIQRNARLNGVESNIRIEGKADAGFLDIMKDLDLNPAGTLVLCDIEGGEFEIIKRSLIDYLTGAKFIIELHDMMISTAEKGIRQKLIAEFPDTYQTRIIRDTPRQWSGIPELEALTDLDRALVTCEGRKYIGEWLIAELT